jgi:hypothetical protein
VREPTNSDFQEPLTMTDAGAQVRVFSVRTGLLKRLEDADGRIIRRIRHFEIPFDEIAEYFGVDRVTMRGQVWEKNPAKPPNSDGD